MSTTLNSFHYVRPGSLTEALGLITQMDERGEPFVFSSGATDLVPVLKQQRGSPGTFLSLSALKELREVRQVAGSEKFLEIGSQITLSELSAHPEIRRILPGLAEAARKVASPQIRNRASIGGNLLVNNRCQYFNQSELNRHAHDACFKAGGEICHVIKNAARGKLPLCQARFVSDLAPVLMVLDASVALARPGGARFVALRDFYLPDGMDRNQLAKNEVITQIRIPLPVPSQGVHYEKLRIRNAIDFPSLGVAVAANKTAAGVQHLAMAVTGVHTHPLFMACPERDVEAAITELTRRAVPMKQDFFPPAYRKKMIAVLVRRGLQKLGMAR